MNFSSTSFNSDVLITKVSAGALQDKTTSFNSNSSCFLRTYFYLLDIGIKACM